VAVAFDAVGPSSSGALSQASTTLSWTHTNVASGVALFVAVSVDKASDAGLSVSVALDPSGANTPFTSLGSIIHSNGATAGFIALFGLATVSSGAHTITATCAGGTPGSMHGGSLSYTGAGASVATAFSTQQSATGNGTASSVTFTGSTSGNMVAAGLCCGSASITSTAGTSRWRVNTNSAATGGAGFGAGSDIAAGGSVTLSWSQTLDFWAVAAVEVLAAAAAGLPDLVMAPRIAGGQ
jgi:hypothetical protein